MSLKQDDNQDPAAQAPKDAEALHFTVEGFEAGNRLDRFVAYRGGVSRAVAIRLIDEGAVRIGGKRGRKGAVLAAGDVVALAHRPIDPLSAAPVPQPELPLSVLYVDDDVVVCNKPAGIPSHPLRAGELGTAASALLGRYPECAAASEHPREGGLCHRLDIFTSGALLAARTPAAWQALRTAFQNGLVDKEYLALVQGVPLGDKGQVSQPLLPAPGRADKMIVAEQPDQTYSKDALDAETAFEALRRGSGQSLLRVRAHTGRRHQVRAHLAYLGLPLVGDVLYGGPALSEELLLSIPPEERAGAGGQFLHAAALRFPLPLDGQDHRGAGPPAAGARGLAPAALARIVTPCRAARTPSSSSASSSC